MCIQPPALPWEALLPAAVSRQPPSRIWTMVLSASKTLKIISTWVVPPPGASEGQSKVIFSSFTTWPTTTS